MELVDDGEPLEWSKWNRRGTTKSDGGVMLEWILSQYDHRWQGRWSEMKHETGIYINDSILVFKQIVNELGKTVAW